MIRPCVLVVGVLALGFAGGCDSDAVEDTLRVRLDLGQPLTVDTFCEGGCAGADELTVRIEYPDYPAELQPRDEWVDFEQFRIDYALSTLDDEVPFFAGTSSVTVAPGDQASFSVTVAGSPQRAFVYDAIGGELAAGHATLTLAGYDWDNNQVFIERDFDIRFVDVVGEIDVSDASQAIDTDTELEDEADSATE